MKQTMHRERIKRVTAHSGMRFDTAHTKPRDSDPVDDTMAHNERGPHRDKHKADNTSALWCFLVGVAVSLTTVAVGEMGGWILLVITLSMGYAWMPRRPVKTTPQAHPKPTQVSPRMQRLLTEPLGMALLGSALLGSMFLVGWLSNV